jgi:hypothetical protein
MPILVGMDFDSLNFYLSAAVDNIPQCSYSNFNAGDVVEKNYA